MEDELPEERVMIIFDNAPCHRSVTSPRDNHVLKYLPPWSPMLNPIEEAFSVLKAEIKSKLSTTQTFRQVMEVNDSARERGMNRMQRRLEILREVLQEAYSAITERKIVSFHNHMLNALPRAMVESPMRTFT